MEFHAQFMFEISPEVLVSACSTTQVLKQASLIINRYEGKSLRMSLVFNGVFLNVSLNSVTKIIVIMVKRLEPVTSCVRDPTKVPSRHM